MVLPFAPVELAWAVVVRVVVLLLGWNRVGPVEVAARRNSSGAGGRPGRRWDRRSHAT